MNAANVLLRGSGYPIVFISRLSQRITAVYNVNWFGQMYRVYLGRVINIVEVEVEIGICILVTAHIDFDSQLEFRTHTIIINRGILRILPEIVDCYEFDIRSKRSRLQQNDW